MDSHLLLRNRRVHRLIVGVPEGGEQIQARLETASGDVVTLQEDTLEALCRAYLSVSTHPRQRALEMRSTPAEPGDRGSIDHRLVEIQADEELLRAEIATAPQSSQNSTENQVGLLAAAPSDQTNTLTQQELEQALRLQTDAKTSSPHRPGPEVEELELDETGDGPIFGGIPTVHSRPRVPRDEGDNS